MFNSDILIYQVLLVGTYTTLVLQKRNTLWLLSALLFLVASVFLRSMIEISEVKDFRPYFESFLEVRTGAIPPELLIEPYRLILFKLVLLFGTYDSMSQIHAIYYMHFGLVTVFFLWLAYLKEISFEVKLILFLAFYPPIAFVWLRAGMAYMATSVLLFYLSRSRWGMLKFLLPTVHLSTIPILLVATIKKITPIRRALIIISAAIVTFFLLESDYATYVINKWNRYDETSDERNSIGLLLLHIVNISIYLYLAIINSNFRKNFVVFLMMATYLSLYYFNPVIGLRVYPFVLIACITQRISFPRHQYLTILICIALIPVFFSRFSQIFI